MKRSKRSPEKSGPLRPGRIKTAAGCILLAAALLLSIAARECAGFAQWYATHLYPVWVGSVGRLAGYAPFSVSEILLYILLLVMIVSGGSFLITKMQRIVTGQRDTDVEPGIDSIAGRTDTAGLDRRPMRVVWEYTVFRVKLSDIFLICAVLAFLYVVNCGINYHRSSFSETSGIATKEYSAEELKEVCRWMTRNVEKYSKEVTRGKDGGMVLDGSLGENAVEAMESLQKEYPELKGYYPKPKKLLNSWILSVQDLSGIYSPFTIEANYNGDMQDYYIPFTACHELSHLRGYMQEQEANFISFLACTGSDEASFVYSGYLAGWVQCMNVLYRTDYDMWEEIRGELPEEAETDIRLSREFWARYDGRIAEVSNKVNDTYLKANGQKDGVKSYNRMVDLIVGYYRNINTALL